MTLFDRVRPEHLPRFRWPSLLAVGVALLASPLVAAQGPPDPDLWSGQYTSDTETDWTDQVPAYIAIVDGDVWLDRDGLTEPAEENTPLIAGDRLRTEAGRVEVLFSDGGSLALDEDSSVAFMSDTLISLDDGRIALTVARSSAASAYRVDAAGTTTWIRSAGEYRITLRGFSADPTVDVRVLRGLAELSTSFGRTLVRAGTESRATSRSAPSMAYAASVGAMTAFDRWVDRQRFDRQGGTASAYLPGELRSYNGMFDRYGAWQYEPAYGYVWYPRVDVGWRPYAVGRWTVIGRYGWTWIGRDRWSWATHHYGRWGLAGARWYWIPGRRWAPAWVSWASAPGYVGWCPLGYDNRPIISINIGYDSGWRAWSVAPARSFYSGVVIASRDVVRPPAVGGRFTLQRAAPARPAGSRLGVAPDRSVDRGQPGQPGVARPRDPRVDVVPRVPPARSAGQGSRVTRGAIDGPGVVSPAPQPAPRSTDRAPAAPSRTQRSDQGASRTTVVPGPVRQAPGRVDGAPSRSAPAARPRVMPTPTEDRRPEAADAPRGVAPGNRAVREAPARPPSVDRPAPAERPAPAARRAAPAARRAAPDAPARTAPARAPERQAPAPRGDTGGSGGQGRAQPRRR